MDFTYLLIGLGIIIALFVIGKIFAILTRIFIIIVIVAAVAVGFFLWQNNVNMKINTKQIDFALSSIL